MPNYKLDLDPKLMPKPNTKKKFGSTTLVTVCSWLHIWISANVVNISSADPYRHESTSFRAGPTLSSLIKKVICSTTYNIVWLFTKQPTTVNARNTVQIQYKVNENFIVKFASSCIRIRIGIKTLPIRTSGNSVCMYRYSSNIIPVTISDHIGK
jgi:hypothetical protein